MTVVTTNSIQIQIHIPADVFTNLFAFSNIIVHYLHPITSDERICCLHTNNITGVSCTLNCQGVWLNSFEFGIVGQSHTCGNAQRVELFLWFNFGEVGGGWTNTG